MKSKMIPTLAGWIFSTALSAAVPYVACEVDTAKRTARSQELKEILAADQADRKVVPFSAEVSLRDRARRERVGQIFGEGCLTTASDYAAAALVYQHGDRADHFYQTFLWAKQAVELGDLSQKRLSALGLDRYLVQKGHPQLFASQATRDLTKPCWCLEPVEEKFPESERKGYMGTSLNEQRAWVDSLNKGAGCGPAKYCLRHLKPTPRGLIPGVW